jgi:EAL domain-containing protein (putative c-di-GMP-specific phosphodiesterase class I)
MIQQLSRDASQLRLLSLLLLITSRRNWGSVSESRLPPRWRRRGDSRPACRSSAISGQGRRQFGHSFEALARWKSEKFGWIGPDLFITIAEEIGLIGELGDQHLRRACLDARSWPAQITLAFNISAIQLRDPAVGSRILAILTETEFSPHRLELEITETALVNHIELAQNVINQLRQAGVRIALDDFGTGYATLSQLLSFKLDRIKIDRSFVARLGKDKDSAIVVRAILGLANGFGLAATAEGIEDYEQLATLRSNGCQEGQGYLFERAVPASEVPLILKKIGAISRASANEAADSKE